MKVIKAFIAAALILAAFSAQAGAVEIERVKRIIPAPKPYGEPQGAVTPDGTFNVRDPGAPFYSERLADAMGLDGEGRDADGNYLDLNRAIYTAYRLAGDSGAPRAVLVLMPGTWAGSMSMDTVARDLLRLAGENGKSGLEVWLLDRRSEQLEDHAGLWWAMQNEGKLSNSEIIRTISDYYRPLFEPLDEGTELMGRRFVPLDHDSLRFMANWGADVAIRDWRAVVLEAHRRVGNAIEGTLVEEARIVDDSAGSVFIGGHSLGGSLTVLYASYDFSRDPDTEILGMNDVSGLVLLEGGSMKPRKIREMGAEKYLESNQKRYEDGKVYFDMDVLGIRYAPSTMASVGIMGWAADNARGEPCEFPDYARPKNLRLPRITNEAVLGYAMDDDASLFFIARASIGTPEGDFGWNGQLRPKSFTIHPDPGECRVITPWYPGHRVKDPSFLYGWSNLDQGPHPDADNPLRKKCGQDDPEVTDFYAFARLLYRGVAEYENQPALSRGPNDFPEWYFPPRLSHDSRLIGKKAVMDGGTELFNATAVNDIDLPVISLVGDDSMGEFSVPTVGEKDFVPGSLQRKETAVHLIKGYTHLDITAATRNFQDDLDPRYSNYNAPSVYTYRFIEQVESSR